jgi:hypothetical protein
MVHPGTTHGLTKRVYNEKGKRINHPLFNVLRGMRERCVNPKHVAYDNYGGRGIYVCSEWLASGKAFVDWAFANGWEHGLQLDRRDNDGPYSPGNCHFITQAKNAKNHRLIRKDNDSGYCGVGFHKRDKTWHARVSYNKKKIHIGTFSTAKEAAIARDKYIIEHGFNLPLNFKVEKQ